MNPTPANQVEEEFEHELQHLQSQWAWFLVLGILLVLLGTTAIVYLPLASLATVWVLGMLLLIGGAATVITAFWAGKWSATLLQILIGVLYIVVGVSINDCAETSLIVLTLFIAIFFILVGIFRMVAAMVARHPQWGWALLNGSLTFLIGMIIYRNLPWSALWAIGLLVGIDLLFSGWTWIMLSLEVRSLPELEEE